MKKLKDIFYDLNDIMVALIIVAVAALVIVTNIDTILAYPTGVAGEIQLPEEETPTDYADNPPISDQGGSNTLGDQDDTDTDGSQGTTGADAGSGDQDTSGSGASDPNSAGGSGGGVSGSAGSGEPVNYSVYINPGSTGDQIADLMISVGLFNSRTEFNSAVTAAGADGKLQAGNFIIPSDSTPAEVIAIITN